MQRNKNNHSSNHLRHLRGDAKEYLLQKRTTLEEKRGV